MPELQSHDEFIHTTGSEATWREAFYFDFFDPATRISSFGYIGVHPNQEIGDCIFALWKEDVLLASFTRWDFNIPRDIGEERLSFSPLSFRPIEPFKTWEIYFNDGRCQVDLTFHAIHPPYSWGQSHGALEKTNSHHYEQQGSYTGSVRIGNERYVINAVGARDHAWGWGARAGIKRWLWASAHFSPKFAFNTFQITLGDDREVLYGYIWRGQQNELIRRSRLQAQYMKGESPTSFVFDLEGQQGGRVSAPARVLNAFNISFQERNKTGYHFFCATEFQSEGQIGYGQTNVHWHKREHRPEQWSVAQD